MKPSTTHPTMHGQGGAALIVGLIMLLLITLAVTAGFTLSNTNLKSVGNMQNRNEAVAASNRAIEEVAASLLLPGVDGSPSLAAPQGTVSRVDINNDGTIDYEVQIAAPTCVRATKSTDTGGGGAVGPGGVGGGASTAGSGLNALPDQYNSVWDISTTVTDAASGTVTSVRQGVRALLSKEQFLALCS
ncbi:PilX domain-containing protein [Variovorax paradoxus B4]|uniref:PilX domain-containing protein n=1 Tax=Variovorax paradoxus B4 TaxID=1246301 RepID=T1XB83_VARPD|nr:PilX domain-containing protein [Variovorax paradoxus]AGU49813.1 PilX domain-containing protein [Variovorax paradoxus B4]